MNNVKSIIFVLNKAVIIKSANPDKDKKNIVADVRKPDMCSMDGNCNVESTIPGWSHYTNNYFDIFRTLWLNYETEIIYTHFERKGIKTPQSLASIYGAWKTRSEYW